MVKPYDKTTHDGKTVDWITHAALLEAEIKLGYRLTIVQGSYHKGVGASAGTHDGGGAVDLAPWDHVRKVRVLRQVGFAIWHRPTIPGVWNEHCHGILIGNQKLAPSAGRQVTAYRNRRDGLAGNRPDRTFRPNPIPTYKWPGSKAALALEAKAKALLDKPVVPVPTVTGLRVDGIDLSHHNTVTQAGLTAAHKAGVRYVYLKATEGSTVKDAAYAARRTMVRNANMLVGAYHFARPDKNGKDGATEARFFLSVAKPAAGDMRPVLDLEDKTLTGPARDKWVADFVAVVKAAIGVTPIIYTPFDLGSAFGCPLWVARYANDNAAPRVSKPWTRWRMRQFSDGKFGKPNQIAGMHVDLNTLHDVADLPWLQIPVKPAPPVVVPTPAPVPTPKPTPAPVPTSLRVVSWNLERDRKPAVVHDEVTALATQTEADVLLFSEANDYFGHLEIPGYRTLQSHDAKIPEMDGTAILVRDGLKITKPGVRKVTSHGWRTARGGMTPPKWAVHATVEGVYFEAVSTPPSQQPAAKRKIMRARASAYDERMRNLKPTAACVFAGDFNVTPDATNVPTYPAPRFKQLGLTLVAPKSGTHGNRTIDFFGVKGVRAGAPTVVSGKRGSDHRPVQVLITKD